MSGAPTHARTMAITSGKGGVGKTCLTANLAWALAQTGRRVLIIDADLGLANLDIVLNVSPTATLHDVISGACALDDAIVPGPGGLHVLAAASGAADYARMTTDLRDRLPALVQTLEGRYDYLLFDTGAGLSDVVLYTASLAQDVIIVATPEPTSMADAYATIKVMATTQQRRRFSLIVNQAPDEPQALFVSNQLQSVIARFLSDGGRAPIELSYLGFVPDDPAMPRAICRRTPVMETAPASPAALAIQALAQRLEAAAATPTSAFAA